ncbi:MAG: NEW3 domain-containing protein [Actinomycetota bacterium]
MKRLVATLAMCLLGLGLMPTVASAAKGKGDVYLINPAGLPMVPGQSGWNGAIWKAGDDDLTEFSVTVTPPSGWSVVYPENRGSDTSLYDNDTLSAGEYDFTAFRLSVPENTTLGSYPVDLYVSYSYLKNGKKEKVVSKRFTLSVSVVAPRDPAFDQLTTSLGQLAADSQSWVDVSYRGRATAFDFKLSVTDAGGASVTYPNDGSFTSLNGDSVLEVGETDRASFRVDTTGMTPGMYTMKTSVSHRVATQPRSAAGTLTFEVIAGAPAPSRPAAGAQIDMQSDSSTRGRARSGATLVEVEARRLCDVAKTTFFSTDALDAQLAQRVTDAGHSLERYEAWRARLSDRPMGMAKVASMYGRMCGIQNPNDDRNASS